jgi:NAD+ kinase
LIIVFGGDGTLLRSARKYLEYDIPILGINMGTVGFLTDVKTEDFESIIQDVLNGNCQVEERNLVSACFA